MSLGANQVSAANPRLYPPGIRRAFYTHSAFAWWILESLYAAVACVLVPMLSFGWPGGSLAFLKEGDSQFSVLSFTIMNAVIFGG